ncbi:MAG: A24 family peptidase [Bacillota bacterium]|nr:A24 family peptidase [Bacillota bacterium]
MNYLIIVLVGFFVGNIIYLYLRRETLTCNMLDDYLNVYIKDVKYYLMIISDIVIFIYINIKVSDLYELLSFSTFSSIMLAISLEDFKSREVNNKIIIVTIILGVLCNLIRNNTSCLIVSILSFCIIGIVFIILYRVSNGGIGAGDVKLLACSGLFLGPFELISTIVIALVFTFLISIILLALKKINRKSMLPFAPFLLAGFLASIF